MNIVMNNLYLLIVHNLKTVNTNWDHVDEDDFINASLIVLSSAQIFFLLSNLNWLKSYYIYEQLIF